MLWLSVIVVSLGLVSVLAIAAIVFIDVAFGEPPQVPAATAPGMDLPLLRGRDLLKFAERRGRNAVARFLSQPRSGESVLNLAADVQWHATRIAANVFHDGTERAMRRCPTAPGQIIELTAPEALLIADMLRECSSPADLTKIREAVCANAERIKDVDAARGTAGVSCPLRCPDGTCAAAGVHPVVCCGRGMQVPSKDGDALPVLAEEFGATLGRGMIRGVSEALTEAGLDGRVYELNSALAAVLDIPDAADRWARNEPVLATCKVCN